MAVSLLDVDPAKARELVNVAHQTSPYSKATPGNIAVEITVN